MTRQLQLSAGGVRGLGYQAVWCPSYRWPIHGGRVAGRCEELIVAKAAGQGWRIVTLAIMPGPGRLFVKAHVSDSPFWVASQFKGLTSRYLRADFAHLRLGLPTLWSWSYLAATGGVVPAETARRYTGTRNERPWRKERAR